MRTVIFDPWSMSSHFNGVLIKHKGGEETYANTANAKAKAGLQQGQTLAASSTGERNTLLPAYQSILKNPGYSAADKSAITTSTLGGLGASFGSASDAAQNRMARTRNTAGFGESLDELARERGRQTSTAEAGLQEKFADTALSERDKALTGESNIYGVDTRTMAELLDPKFAAPKPGFWSTFGNSVAGGLGSIIGGGGGSYGKLQI